MVAYAAPAATLPAPHASSIHPASPVQATAKPATNQLTGEEAKLHTSLEAFAKKCIISMNRQRRPGIASKEVHRHTDGTYRARYMAIDPDSLQISFSPTDGNKVIKYIGRMAYHEVEYVCIGKDQKQALSGPFNESNREPVTELIKFKSGKWGY